MSQHRVTAPFNITLSLAFLLVGVTFLALMMGMIPQHRRKFTQQRIALCETIACSTSLAIQRKDRPLMEQILATAVQRNPQLRQAVVTKIDGDVIHQEGALSPESADALDLVSVPIAINGAPWGSVDLQFGPMFGTNQKGMLSNSLVRFLLFIGSAGFLVMFIYLRRVLQYLDPSRVIPERVRTTLDTLAEGLVVVDQEGKIVLANNSFAEALHTVPEDLIGCKISTIQWDNSAGEFPWTQAIRTQEAVTGSVLRLTEDDGEGRTFRVNSAPIVAEDGTCQGALTSFDDVTALEKRTVALTQMLERLKTSRDKIRRQNEELHVLATRDPLTTALNRRSFFDQLNAIWREAEESGQPLSCAMIDVDYFKKINDNHGHAMGDFVLRSTVALLQELARPDDLICRYGGEEFCLVFPNTSAEDAVLISERIRQRIEEHDFNGIGITASIGTSGIEFGADELQKLIDQADQSLYWAKRSGRNRVGAYDKIPQDFDLQSTPESELDQSNATTPIPFQTVSSLLAALAYRDVSTAEHSRRVADMCVQMADGLMSCTDSYVLENAALLHDIGKIGVPDHILLKPTALTEKEWEVMRCHDEISVEIIRSTFVCEQLTKIVQTHHAWYGGRPEHPDLPVGRKIPLGARILTIADSYDAMVSDRVYRKGMSQADAFTELRTCAGTQFDPHLVERFVAIMSSAQRCKATTDEITDKRGALLVGQEIENLARAIDNRDIDTLRNLAVRVRETAEQFSIGQIRDLADELHNAIGMDDDEWLNTLELTIELIELCRQTQRIHLSTRAVVGNCQRYSGVAGLEPMTSIPVESVPS